MSKFGVIQKWLFKPTIPLIRISAIDASTTYNLANSLKRVNLNTAKALAITVNSSGGSIAQATLINQKIREFSRKNHLKVYSFAEDTCLSSSYIVLSSADKIFANKHSILGGLILNSTSFGMKNALESTKIEVRNFVSDKNKIWSRNHFLQDLNDNEHKCTTNLVQNSQEGLNSFVNKLRESEIKLPQTDRNSVIYSGNLFNSQEAIQYGLVDDFGTPGSTLYKLHPNARIVDLTEKDILARRFDQLKNLTKILTSKALPWILGYVCIKMTIRLYVLFLIITSPFRGEK